MTIAVAIVVSCIVFALIVKTIVVGVRDAIGSEDKDPTISGYDSTADTDDGRTHAVWRTSSYYDPTDAVTAPEDTWVTSTYYNRTDMTAW